MSILSRQTQGRVPANYLQTQTTECGLAALAMLLGHFGRFVTLDELRQVSGVSRDCVNAADLVRTAHKTSAEFGMRNAELNPQSAIRNPQCILLVEDSALVRAMEKRILEDAGYEVVAAVDGMDALDALGRSPFAAVVSDIVMPNMDGLTLTARIRQEPRYKDLPVILVTTLSSDEDKRRGLEAGANAYIPKPSFDQRVLLETLQRLIVR